MAVLAASPTPASAAPSETEKAAKLQRAGEDLYDADDFEGARRSWLAAFEAIEVSYENHGTLVTLLVLASSASIQQHARADDPAVVEDMLGRIVDFESNVTDLDPELAALVADERRRLQQVLQHATSTPVPPPRDLEDPTDRTDEPATRPGRQRPWVPFVVGGGVGFASGIASIAAGAAFGPRARAQVEDSPDPASRTDAFVRDERSKGLIWVGVGTALAVTGISLVAFGLLRRADRHGRRTARNRRSRGPQLVMGGVRW